MRYIALFAIALGLVVSLCANTVLAEVTIPDLKGPINDYANVLTADQVTQLNQSLLEKEKATGNQVVVLIVNSMDGLAVEDYASKVFKTWKLGEKEKNNGVLFVISLGDRRMHIEVGYGLEPTLTDSVCGRILSEKVHPLTKEKKYSEAITACVTAIEQTISGTGLTASSPPAPAPNSKAKAPAVSQGVLVLFVLVAIVCCAIPRGVAWLAGIIAAAACFFVALSLLSLGIAIICAIVGFFAGVILSIMGPDIGGGYGGSSWSSSDSGSSGGSSGGGGASSGTD